MTLTVFYIAGSCVDRVNGYSCTCREGYLGLHCDIDNRGCRSGPCLNGATCASDKGDNDYTCLCISGSYYLFNTW